MIIEKTKFNHLLFGFLAVNFLAFGVALFIRVNIGFAAFDTFVITIQHLFNIENYGNTALFIQSLFFCYLFLFRKKLNLVPKEIMITFIGILLITRFINFYNMILVFITQAYFNEFIVFGFGLLFLSFGLYLFSVINSITPPIDKFSVSYSKYKNTSYSNVKLCLDATMVCIALILLYTFDLGVPINAYTIFLTFAPGYVIKLFEHVLKIKMYDSQDYTRLKSQI